MPYKTLDMPLNACSLTFLLFVTAPIFLICIRSLTDYHFFCSVRFP